MIPSKFWKIPSNFPDPRSRNV